MVRDAGAAPVQRTAPGPAVGPGASDEALMAAWRAGDERAFRVLFERYRGRVTNYAWQMVRRREVAEEVCLEAFCRLVEGAWRPSGSFRSFLYTVVHRLCLDALRRRSRRDRALLRLRVPRPEPPGPDAMTQDAQQRAQLTDALAALPEEHRAVLLLYYHQELRSREVAEVLGLEDHQVRSRLSYARRLLRQQLAEPEETP